MEAMNLGYVKYEQRKHGKYAMCYDDQGNFQGEILTIPFKVKLKCKFYVKMVDINFYMLETFSNFEFVATVFRKECVHYINKYRSLLSTYYGFTEDEALKFIKGED